MRMRIMSVLAAGCLAGLAGCESSGLSPREVRGQDYASYVFSMYEPGDATASAGERKPIATPAKIAVAQLGEVGAPQKMVESLQAERATFARVDSVPGVMAVAYTHGQTATMYDQAVRQNVQEHADRIRRIARDLGADYLFLYGGTVDHATTSTPLSLMNATIVGIWLVPSEKIEASARASGSLIDVRSGRVVLSVSADAQDERLSPTAATEGDNIKVLKAVRDEVVLKLGEALTARVKEEQSAGTGG